MKYTVEKISLSYGKRLPKGCLNEIIEGVTSKYDLDSSDVCSIEIRKGATRSNDVIIHRMHGGHISIGSKRGQKYEMDRDNWTTFRNFSNMHDHVIEEMCDAGIAEKLDSPVRMERDEEEC